MAHNSVQLFMQDEFGFKLLKFIFQPAKGIITVLVEWLQRVAILSSTIFFIYIIKYPVTQKLRQLTLRSSGQVGNQPCEPANQCSNHDNVTSLRLAFCTVSMGTHDSFPIPVNFNHGCTVYFAIMCSVDIVQVYDVTDNKTRSFRISSFRYL